MEKIASNIKTDNKDKTLSLKFLETASRHI